MASLAATRSATDIGSCSIGADSQLGGGVEVAGLAVDERGVGAAVAPLARLAVPRDRHVDQRRVLGGQRLEVETPRRHHARPEVLDQDVDGAGQPAHELAALGLRRGRRAIRRLPG